MRLRSVTVLFCARVNEKIKETLTLTFLILSDTFLLLVAKEVEIVLKPFLREARGSNLIDGILFFKACSKFEF